MMPGLVHTNEDIFAVPFMAATLNLGLFPPSKLDHHMYRLTIPRLPDSPSL